MTNIFFSNGGYRYLEHYTALIEKKGFYFKIDIIKDEKILINLKLKSITEKEYFYFKEQYEKNFTIIPFENFKEIYAASIEANQVIMTNIL